MKEVPTDEKLEGSGRIPICLHKDCSKTGYFKFGYCREHMPSCPVCGRKFVKALFQVHPTCRKRRDYGDNWRDNAGLQ